MGSSGSKSGPQPTPPGSQDENLTDRIDNLIVTARSAEDDGLVKAESEKHAAAVEATVGEISSAALRAAFEAHTPEETQESMRLLVAELRVLFEGRIRELEAAALKSAKLCGSMQVERQEETEAHSRQIDVLVEGHAAELEKLREEHDILQSQLDQLQDASTANERKQQEELDYHKARSLDFEQQSESHRVPNRVLEEQMGQLQHDHSHNHSHVKKLHDSRADRVNELEREIEDIRENPSKHYNNLRTAAEQIGDREDELKAHAKVMQLEEQVARLQEANETAVKHGSNTEAEYQRRIAELEEVHHKRNQELEHTVSHNLKFEQAMVTLQESHQDNSRAAQTQLSAHQERVKELERDLSNYAETHEDLKLQAQAEADEKHQHLQRVTELERDYATAHKEREAHAAQVSRLKAELEQTRAAVLNNEAHGELASQLQAVVEDLRTREHTAQAHVEVLTAEVEDLRARFAKSEAANIETEIKAPASEPQTPLRTPLTPFTPSVHTPGNLNLRRTQPITLHASHGRISPTGPPNTIKRGDKPQTPTQTFKARSIGPTTARWQAGVSRTCAASLPSSGVLRVSTTRVPVTTSSSLRGSRVVQRQL